MFSRMYVITSYSIHYTKLYDFGFENRPELCYEGVPQEAFFALSFDGSHPRGRVQFHEAFLADGPVQAESDA